MAPKVRKTLAAQLATQGLTVRVEQRPHATHLAAALLLALHSALSVHALRRQSVTVDEAFHVPAGLSNWQTGRFSAYRVNPPLIRLVATLPLLTASPKRDYSLLSDSPGRNMGTTFARHFAHVNAEHYFGFFVLARYPILVLSVIGGWYVFAWSKQLYGRAAAFTAVALWSFSPTVLAHAQLATCDLGAAVVGFVATYHFWRYLEQPSWPRVIGSGILLGLAQLSKFTLLALYVIWPLMWLLHRIAPPAQSGKVETKGPPAETQATSRCRTVTAQAAVMVLASVIVVNTGYAFQGSFRRLGDLDFLSHTLAASRSGNRFRDTALAGLPVPLPEQYVLGIDAQKRDLEAGLPTYLRGESRRGGWWYYYLYALAVKVPVGTWILFAIAVAMAWNRPGEIPKHLLLIAPIAVFLALVSSQTGVQYLRYALPLFPFFFVFTGSCAILLEHRSRFLRLLAALVLLWVVASSVRTHPHYLSYFNELAGGPHRGGHHLLDSNIDWGQDLFALERWLDDHPEARPLKLAYFNLVVDPRLVGLRYSLPPPGPPSSVKLPTSLAGHFGPVPGWHAVSVNFVYGLPFHHPDGQGGWTAASPGAYAYFQHFQPVAKAGYSIFIYHITPEQADRVRRELGMPPLPNDN